MSVFRLEGDKKEKVMDNVDLIRVEGDDLILSGLFGESRKIKGNIIKIDNEKHEISIK